MKLEEAKAFMWKENNKNPSVIQWQHHKTIRDLHDSLVVKIYDDHKLELEVEYKRGWKDGHTQSDLENRSCKECKYWYKEKGCDLTYWQDYSHGYGFESEADDYCSRWEQIC